MTVEYAQTLSKGPKRFQKVPNGQKPTARLILSRDRDLLYVLIRWNSRSIHRDDVLRPAQQRIVVRWLNLALLSIASPGRGVFLSKITWNRLIHYVSWNPIQNAKSSCRWLLRDCWPLDARVLLDIVWTTTNLSSLKILQAELMTTSFALLPHTFRTRTFPWTFHQLWKYLKYFNFFAWNSESLKLNLRSLPKF